MDTELTSKRAVIGTIHHNGVIRTGPALAFVVNTQSTNRATGYRIVFAVDFQPVHTIDATATGAIFCSDVSPVEPGTRAAIPVSGVDIDTSHTEARGGVDCPVVNLHLDAAVGIAIPAGHGIG